jgi:hypothetical protein
MSSMPFFGEFESIDTTAIRSPRFLCIIHRKGHMLERRNIEIPSSYVFGFNRFPDIGFPISLITSPAVA